MDFLLHDLGVVVKKMGVKSLVCAWADVADRERSRIARSLSLLGKQLSGEVQLSYQPSGFLYVLEVPLSSLTVKA